MNFNTLKSLEIPEGVVTQIADASGNVLWSAVEESVVIFDGTVYLKAMNEEVILNEPLDLNKAYLFVFDGVEYGPMSPYMDGDGMLHLGAWEDYSTMPIGIFVGDLEDPTFSVAAWDMTGPYNRKEYPLTITCIGQRRVITFTIAGTTYSADEGMTWGEWVESDYNTIGASIQPDGRVFIPPFVATDYGMGYQYSAEVIQPSAAYVTSV